MMKIEPDIEQNVKKNDMAKWVSVSISNCKNTASLKCKTFCQKQAHKNLSYTKMTEIL